MASNCRKFKAIFHEDATSIGNGKEYSIGLGHVTMVVAVTGTASGFTLVFEGKSHDNDVYSAIPAFNLATFDMATTATTNGKYCVSLEGLTKIRVRLSGITSGGVDVIGTIVD